MHTLLKKVRAARRRIMAGRLLQSAVKHLFFAGCFAAALVWIGRWFPSLPSLKIAAIAGGVALLVATVRVMSRPVSLRSAALVLDRTNGSEERIATALVLKDDASPAAKAVMDDAIRVAQSIDPSRVAIAPPRAFSWMALPVVAMLLGIAIPISVATSEKADDPSYASTPLLPAPIRKERSADLHRRAFDLEKRAKDLEKPKLKDLAEAMRDTAEAMRRDEMRKGEAMAKISTLEEKAKSRREELSKDSELIKNMMKHRDDLGAGSPEAAAASQKAKELDEKLSKLDDKVKQALKDAAKNGSSEELKKALKELAEGMKGLEGDKLEDLQKQLDEMANGESQDSEAMKKLLESLDDKLADFQGDLSELEMLDDELDALEAMKGDFDEDGEKCLACGHRKGRG